MTKRYIYLQPEEFKQNKLYNFNVNDELYFKYGSTLQTLKDYLPQNLILFTNYTSEEQGSRFIFRPWNDKCMLLTKPGLFKFFLVENCFLGKTGRRYSYQNFTGEYGCKKIISGNFTVSAFPLEELSMQSYVSKLLGPFQNFGKVMDFDHRLSYNAFHFTPLSKLGDSDSAYSIKNPLEIDPRYNTSWEDLKRFLTEARKQYRSKMVVDVVWNHLANDSPFLVEYPNSTYNLKNCPWLKKAFLLDMKIQWLCRNDLKNLNINEDEELIRNVLKNFNFTDEYTNNVISGAKYNMNEIKKPVISPENLCITPYFLDHKIHDPDIWSKEIDQFCSYLENHMSENAEFIQAHNGWVMGWDASKDFALVAEVYENRRLIAWGDSVKLNYGKKPSDSPQLWKLMTNYTVLMSSVFDGLRIDNCHSTPQHVADYLLCQARRCNPGTFTMLELFTGSESTDIRLASQLGANCLIRETLSCRSLRKLGEMLWKFGGNPIGSLKSVENLPEPVKRDSVSRVAPAIVYDITHDNESYHQAFGCDYYKIAYPFTALAMFCSAGFGSTRGHDEEMEINPNVVTCKDKYRWDKETTHMMKIKSVINNACQYHKLHEFTEQFVDMMSDSICVVTRRNTSTNQFCFLCVATDKTTINLDKLDIKNDHIEHKVLIDAELNSGSLTLNPGGVALILEAEQKLPKIDIPKLPTNIDELAELLFSCENEEKFRTGRGMYDIPNYGKLKFSGLQGCLKFFNLSN